MQRLRAVFLLISIVAIFALSNGAHAEECEIPPSVGVSVSVDTNGLATATVSYSFPETTNAGQRGLTLWVGRDGDEITGFLGGIQPAEISGTWVVTHDLSCEPSGSYTYKAVAGSCDIHVRESSASLSYTTDPTVSVSYNGPDDQGHGDVVVDYNFPNTSQASQRTLLHQIHDSGGFGWGGSLNPPEQSGNWTFPYNMTCRSGTFTHKIIAIHCNGTEEEATATVTVSTQPSVSVSVGGMNEFGEVPLAINYGFPNTDHQSQRGITVRIEDASTGGWGTFATTQPATQYGTWPLIYNVGCDNRQLNVWVIATSCTGEDDETKQPLPKPEEPTVSVALSKGTAPGTVDATIDYDMGKGSANWSIRLDLLSWEDADGATHSGHILMWPETTPTRRGRKVFNFTPPSRAQHLMVRATAATCVGSEEARAGFECDLCPTKGAASSADPVFFSSGNVRVTDVDPLPPIAGRSLVRTYNSDEQVIALFGRGWTTLFDRRMIRNKVDNQDVGISFVTATNTVMAFREVAGVFQQVWPRARRSSSVLTYDVATDTYRLREPGSSEMAVFQGSNGKLIALRDLTSGREALITYDAGGLPQTLTDSWSGTSWILTIANRRVSSIAVGGRPDLVWTYTYDGAGNLTTVRAPADEIWRTYEYAADRMTASRDGLGNLIESHTYDAMGYGISSTGPSDEIASIAYDLPGSVAGERVTRVTYKTGAVADYVLRASGGAWRSVAVTGACSSCGAREATYARDAEGRVVREQNADGYVVEDTYDATNLIRTRGPLRPEGCDPATDANRCRQTPDALAAIGLVVIPETVTTHYSYDDPNWPDRVTTTATTSIVDPTKQKTETVTYDAATGEVLSRAVTGWTGSPVRQESRVTTIALYDGIEGPAFDPGGAFQTTWLSLPQPAGLLKAADGPRQDVADVTRFVYYPIDPSVPLTWRGQVAGTRNAAGHIVRFEDYDVFGRPSRVIDPNGVAQRVVVDRIGRVAEQRTDALSGCDTAADPLCNVDIVQHRTYSGAGPLQSEQRPGGGVTVYEYDNRGRLFAITRGPSPADAHERIEYQYDAATGEKSEERLVARESGIWIEKKRSTYLYNELEQLQQIVHADGAAAHYAYDASGRISSIRDENHTSPNTDYRYDSAGRLTQVRQTLSTAPGGEIRTLYAYDRHGNLTSVTDPNGNVTTYAYDDFGQLVRQTSPVTGTTLYTYDAAGQLVSTTDANGAVTTRSYDALGRVLSATSVQGTHSESVSWAYDSGTFGLGRLASMTDPTGTAAYTNDRRGLLLSETKTIDGTPYTTAFRYDADGNRTRVTYPSGRMVDYQLDHASRPISAVMGETTLVSAASYLPFGPMREIVYGNGTTRTMTYDARYRPLTNELTGPLTSSEGETTTGVIASYGYTHDNAGNITRIADAVDPAYDREFAYDELHRLITANGGTALWGAGSYAYDRMGNLLSSAVGENLRTFSMSGTTPKIANLLTEGRTDAVSYDGAGNEIVVGARTFEYSPRNHLQVTADRLFTYDGRGVRTSTIFTLTLAAFSLDVTTASPNQTVTGTVSLSAPAPAGGIVVRMASSGSAVTVPDELIIGGGQVSATFTFVVSPEAQAGIVTLTATYATTLSTALTITGGPALATFTATPPDLVGGSAITAQVSLAEVAPEGGALVAITAEREEIAGGTISIAAGETTGSTVLDSYPVLIPVTVPLIATYGSSSLQASVVVRPETVADHLILAPDGVIGGESANGTISLAAPAPEGGRTFTLTSSNPSVATVPASIEITEGMQTAQLPITTFSVLAATPVTITASEGATTLEAVLTVVCPTGSTPEPSFPPGQTVFIDESLPPGASMTGSLGWDTSQAASGDLSLVAPYAGSGVYRTIITGLSEPVSSSDKLFVHARVADCAMPRQIVLRAKAGGTPVTAYWGQPIWGVTPQSIYMGNVPDSGSWQQLDILLRDVEWSGDPAVSEIELAHVDGHVWFDRIGRMTDCVSEPASQPTAPTDEDVFIDDETPSWVALENTANGPLAWTSAQAASGSLSLVHPYRGEGTYVTGITSLAQPLVSGAKLSLYAMVDTCSPPVRQIHLRITTTSGSGTVSWGEPVWDVEPTTMDMGAVPASGSWVRLEVPLGQLGLDSGTLTRLDVAHVDGRVWFDRIATWPQLRALLTGFTADQESPMAHGTTVTWTATATGTVYPLEYRFERRDPEGNWSIVQNYGMQNTHSWTPTAEDLGNHAVRVSVRNGGSLADFEDTDTLLIRIIESGEGLLWNDPDVRLAWWKRWLRPPAPPVSLSVPHQSIATTTEGVARRHSLYSPELQLLAETSITTATSPPIEYEYIWFAGQPLAQIATATGAIDWYFNDHLGTPILQNDAEANLTWRVEYDPYGVVHHYRVGAEKHQPLRFPGQENDGGSELSYNIFRWYRAGWGRYTQADPIGLNAGTQLYPYSGDHPINGRDPLGLYYYRNEVSLFHDAVVGSYTSLPGGLNVTYSCGCDIKTRAFRLLFDIRARTEIHISVHEPKSSWGYFCDLQAEANHVSIFDSVLRRSADKVLPFEKKPYSTEGDCMAAGAKAYKAMEESIRSFGEFAIHTAAQLLEEIRHNTYNPCPFPGTP